MHVMTTEHAYMWSKPCFGCQNDGNSSGGGEQVPPPLVVAVFSWPRNLPRAIPLNVSPGVSIPTEEPPVQVYSIKQGKQLNKQKYEEKL